MSPDATCLHLRLCRSVFFLLLFRRLFSFSHPILLYSRRLLFELGKVALRFFRPFFLPRVSLCAVVADTLLFAACVYLRCPFFFTPMQSRCRRRTELLLVNSRAVCSLRCPYARMFARERSLFSPPTEDNRKPSFA